MQGLNEVTLVGRLGGNPERKGDRGPVKLSVATERRVKDGDDWKSVTDWHSVTVWGREAENCEKFLEKGSTVCVKAHLEVRKWETDDGKRSEVQIVAERVVFLDPPKKRDDDRDDDRGRSRDRGRDDRDDRGRDARRAGDDDRRSSASKGKGKEKPKARDDEDETFDDDVPF